MVINSSSSSISQQLNRQPPAASETRKAQSKDLLEQLREVSQDEITLGAGETGLAQQPLPVAVSPAIEIQRTLQTHTTMETITQRFKDNFAEAQERGRIVNLRV